MSNKNNNSESFFSNQDTIVRRAWINTALEGVRARLNSGFESDGIADSIECIKGDVSAGTPDREAAAQPATAAKGSAPAGLYVAWSAQARRSGT